MKALLLLMKKLLFVLLAIGLAVATGYGVYVVFFTQLKLDTANPANQPPLVLEPEKNLQVTEYSLVATASGQTALGLLESAQEVELKQYDFGAMISVINGLAANKSYYWAFYINDEYAKQAADKTALNAGDKVKFKYEKIEAFPL